jgi:Mu transposase, C-terminal domain
VLDARPGRRLQQGVLAHQEFVCGDQRKGRPSSDHPAGCPPLSNRDIRGEAHKAPHRETAAVPAARLAAERERLHPLPDEPHALALGEERLVAEDQTVRFGSVRYSTPPGHAGTRVWCRVAGKELVITARTGRGAAQIALHRLSVPGSPSICDEHYPHHPGGNGPCRPRPRPRTEAEAAFLAIGDGAQRWLAEAAACGAARIRSKMARAVELAAVVGADKVDAALGLAAIAGRFADGDLASIIDHLAAEREIGQVVIPGEAHSAQPGTAGWARLGAQEAGR